MTKLVLLQPKVVPVSAVDEPQKLTDNLYMIGDSKRNAAGTMNLQYIANKRKCTVIEPSIPLSSTGRLDRQISSQECRGRSNSRCTLRVVQMQMRLWLEF